MNTLTSIHKVRKDAERGKEAERETHLSKEKRVLQFIGDIGLQGHNCIVLQKLLLAELSKASDFLSTKARQMSLQIAGHKCSQSTGTL